MAPKWPNQPTKLSNIHPICWGQQQQHRLNGQLGSFLALRGQLAVDNNTDIAVTMLLLWCFLVTYIGRRSFGRNDGKGPMTTMMLRASPSTAKAMEWIWLPPKKDSLLPPD